MVVKSYMNYNGGAKGSDYYWMKYGKKYQIQTTVLSFENHYIFSASEYFNKIILSMNELIKADEELYIANNKLNRTFPPFSNYALNLLRRDYYQVLYVDGIFAIGNLNLSNQTVDRGTGWAIQCGIQLQKQVNVYNINDNNWYSFDYNMKKFIKKGIPYLTERFAGIGTRGIEIKGKNKKTYEYKQQWIEAIINVYEQSQSV